MKTKYLIIAGILLGALLSWGSGANAMNTGMNRKELSCQSYSVLKDTTDADSAWTIFGQDGTVKFSEETIHLFSDAAYRANTYPHEYKLSQVPDLLDKGKVPLALWTLINTYESAPDSTRTIAFMLAERGIKGQHFLNAFYTYAFADPEVVHLSVQDGSYLEHPQRLEEKLENCRTLAAYTDKFLKMRSAEK